jgi:ADP-L-glycero-D-manno-heptose 6-epimerase
MKKILITGGAGFIGSNIAWELQNRFPEFSITIFDHFNDGSKRSSGNFNYFGDFRNIIGLKAEIIIGDISNIDDVNNLLKNKFDIIFHQGAISDTTVVNQNEVLKTNLSSFKLFLEYCLENNSKLIYASSAGTYGNSLAPNRVGFGEYPENIYGFSKLYMDQLSRYYLNLNKNLHIVGLRYFNVYGHRELYKGKTSSMVLQLAMQAIYKNSVRIFSFGEQSRDFVYIKDVVDANILAIDGKSGIYNIGSGISRSFNDVINILEINLDKKIQVNFFENPFSFYQNNTCADLNESLKCLGFSPNYTLEKGIGDYLKFIESYPSTYFDLNNG